MFLYIFLKINISNLKYLYGLVSEINIKWGSTYDTLVLVEKMVGLNATPYQMVLF